MRQSIDRALDVGNLDALVEVLGDARPVEIRYAARRLLRASDGGAVTLERVAALAARPEATARRLACALVPTCYRTASKGTTAVLLRLVDDGEPAVRESAVAACGTLLRDAYAKTIDTLRTWRTHASPNVRRAVVSASIKAARTRRLEWAEPLLRLVEPLMEDRDVAVRRALGPSALSGALLRFYQDATFEYLVKWSTSNDAQVLWNVAMALSGPPAARIVKKALIILRRVSLDERRYVWRAVASAMWKLGRRRPEIVRTELARWLEDERRVEIAREALKYL